MRIRQNRFVVVGIVDAGRSVAVAVVVRAGDSMIGFRSPTIHNLPRFDSENCPWYPLPSGARTRPRVQAIAPRGRELVRKERLFWRGAKPAREARALPLFHLQSLAGQLEILHEHVFAFAVQLA